jgi:hypothetical protein
MLNGFVHVLASVVSVVLVPASDVLAILLSFCDMSYLFWQSSVICQKAVLEMTMFIIKL